MYNAWGLHRARENGFCRNKIQRVKIQVCSEIKVGSASELEGRAQENRKEE
jgi:hypothetical protein